MGYTNESVGLDLKYKRTYINNGVVILSKAKAKGGTGRGTGKKGWTRWQAGAKKAKAKPYVSKGAKKPDSPKTTGRIETIEE
jgi:hypothetical protein